MLSGSRRNACCAWMLMLPPVPSLALAMIWLFWSSTYCGSMVILPPRYLPPTDLCADRAIAQPQQRRGRDPDVPAVGLGGACDHTAVGEQDRGLRGDGDIPRVAQSGTLRGQPRPVSQRKPLCLEGDITPMACPAGAIGDQGPSSQRHLPYLGGGYRLPAPPYAVRALSVPPSSRSSVGVERIIWPAAAPKVELASALGAPSLVVPVMVTASVAAIVIFPPAHCRLGWCSHW